MKEKTRDEVLDEIKKDAIENHVPILQDKSLELILMILNIKKPNKILEIGTAVGYSAINFSKYLNNENSKIITIERNETRYKKAIENVNKANLQDNIEIIYQDAVEYLDIIDKQEEFKESFDVIFIDAAKGQYLKFLESAMKLIKKDGIIIADNVLFKGRVLSDYNEHRNRTAVNRLRTYLETISNDERLDSHLFDIGDGIAVSVVKK